MDHLEEWDKREVDKIWEEGGSVDGMISIDKAKIIEAKYPELSRNTGAGILTLIYNGEVKRVQLDEDFKKDTLWCEYFYTINLDDETVSMNDGKKYLFSEWTEELMERLENEDDEPNDSATAY